MNEIANRLRAEAADAERRHLPIRQRLCTEAADEIERLEVKARQLASTLATHLLDTDKDKEIEQLRETLRKCATEMAWQHAEIKRLHVIIARAKDALSDE